MANTLKLVLWLMGALSVAAAYTGPDLPPGPYCGKGPIRCCTNRQDHCSHEILGTKCYCDEFCNRGRVHDDCCPDYEPVCLGDAPGPIIKKPRCKYGRNTYEIDATVQDDCHTCTCLEDPDMRNASWACDRSEPCLMSERVISGVNTMYTSWKATNYSFFYGKKLKEGIKYKLGTFPLSIETKRMGAIRYDKQIDYPRNFDARVQWRDYISPIVDQGWCGSDWAVSIATVASDRFAIQSNGAETLVLSPQSLLSCNRRDQQGCDGGHIDVAWNYATEYGLVDEDCFPYVAKAVQCKIDPRKGLKGNGCVPSVRHRKTLYKVGPPTRLKKEFDIMYDIMESGPVHAIMTVYQDFFHYRDGVYRHSPYGDNSVSGLHSVRILGWGEDGRDKYWIVANSWGPEWGENGYFKIARGENESGIESFVVSVLMDVVKADK